MPAKIDLIDQVASQMMRSGKKGRLTIPEKQKAAFAKRHEKQIFWVIKNFPRCSSAVHAVVVKCMIKYNDNERVVALAKALRFQKFSGRNDPAYLLYRFLQRHLGADFVVAYKTAVATCRAYMENRELKKIKLAETDIFDWDEDYSVPDDLLANWLPDEIPEDVSLQINSEPISSWTKDSWDETPKDIYAAEVLS